MRKLYMKLFGHVNASYPLELDIDYGYLELDQNLKVMANGLNTSTSTEKIIFKEPTALYLKLKKMMTIFYIFVICAGLGLGLANQENLLVMLVAPVFLVTLIYTIIKYLLKEDIDAIQRISMEATETTEKGLAYLQEKYPYIKFNYQRNGQKTEIIGYIRQAHKDNDMDLAQLLSDMDIIEFSKPRDVEKFKQIVDNKLEAKLENDSVAYLKVEHIGDYKNAKIGRFNLEEEFDDLDPLAIQNIVAMIEMKMEALKLGEMNE